MLDKKRIRLMTKMAIYEQSDAREDMKISSYYKEDYVGTRTLIGALWTIIGYALVMVLFVLCNMDALINDMSMQKLIVLICAAVAGYLVLLIVYCVCANLFYKRKHAKARQRIKAFYSNMATLERLSGYGGHRRSKPQKRRKTKDKSRVEEKIL